MQEQKQILKDDAVKREQIKDDSKRKDLDINSLVDKKRFESDFDKIFGAKNGFQL